ncbi:MAG: DUF6446 family protein [Rhodobacteraceae bacterium]|nr:DUF6446 family protein [Paracoccaceae bacterium]
MSGKTLIIGMGVFLTIFTVALYLTQIYGFYQKVNDLPSIMVEGREVAVDNYVGLDADSSGLKLRGCFNVDPAEFDGVTLHNAAIPLGTPKWFDCYDPAQIHADIKSGASIAYSVAVNELDGLDRIVVVYPDGRAYQWRQINEKYQE